MHRTTHLALALALAACGAGQTAEPAPAAAARVSPPAPVETAIPEACAQPKPPPSEKPVQLVVTTDKFGPIQGDQPIDRSGLMSLFPGLTVERVVRDRLWERYEAYEVSAKGSLLFDVVPDVDGRPMVEVYDLEILADPVSSELDAWANSDDDDSKYQCTRSRRRTGELLCPTRLQPPITNIAYVIESEDVWAKPTGQPEAASARPSKFLWWPPGSLGPEKWRYWRVTAVEPKLIYQLALDPDRLRSMVRSSRGLVIVRVMSEMQPDVFIHACGRTLDKQLAQLLPLLQTQIRRAVLEREIVCHKEPRPECRVPPTMENAPEFTLVFSEDRTSPSLLALIAHNAWQGSADSVQRIQRRADALIRKIDEGCPP